MDEIQIFQAITVNSAFKKSICILKLDNLLSWRSIHILSFLLFQPPISKKKCLSKAIYSVPMDLT